jgi:hypothetical protein
MRGSAAVIAVLALALVAPQTAAADHFISPDEDVWVTRVSNPPAVLGIGASIRVSDTTTNRRDTAARAAAIRYYLSRDDHRNRGDRVLGRRALPSLGAGRSSRGSATVTIPRVRSGSYRLLACFRDNCRPASRSVAVKRSAAPVLVVNEPNLGSYARGEPPKPIAPNLTGSDADDALMSGATVRIDAPVPGEQLSFEPQLGVTGTYDSGTGILTLRGQASTAAYQQALRSVSYSHNGANPSPKRTIEFRALDAVRVASTPVYTSIDVTVN